MDYLRKFVQDYCNNIAFQTNFSSEDCKMLEVWNKKLVGSASITNEELIEIFSKTSYPITQMYICSKMQLPEKVIQFIIEDVENKATASLLLMQYLTTTQISQLEKKIGFTEMNHMLYDKHFAPLVNPDCVDYIAKKIFKATNELAGSCVKNNIYNSIKYTKNKALIEEFLNDAKYINEQKLSMIVNNENMPLDIRLRAFHMGCDFDLLDLDKQLPYDVLTEVYRSLADAHTEYNALVTDFHSNINFQTLSQNQHLPFDCQMDYVMRWMGSRTSDHILNNILMTTTHSGVLEKATELISISSNLAYENINIPRKCLEKRIGKLYKQIKTNIKKDGLIKMVYLKRLIECIDRLSFDKKETNKLLELENNFINMNLLRKSITGDAEIDSSDLKKFMKSTDYWCRYYATLSYITQHPPKETVFTQAEKVRLVGISKYLQYEYNSDYRNEFREDNTLCGTDFSIAKKEKTKMLRGYETLLGQRKELYNFLIGTIEQTEKDSNSKIGYPLLSFKEHIEKYQNLQEFWLRERKDANEEILKSELREIAGIYCRTINESEYVYNLSNPIVAMNFYESLCGFTERIEENYKQIKEIEKEEKKTEMEI